MAFRSPLASMASSGAALPDAEVRAMAERAWIENGIAVIKPSWLANDQDRRRLVELVNRVHGARRVKG